MQDWIKKIFDKALNRDQPSAVDSKISAVGSKITAVDDPEKEKRVAATKRWTDFAKKYYEENKDVKEEKAIKFVGSRRNRNDIFDAMDRGEIVDIKNPNSTRYLDKATGQLLMPSEEAMYGDTLHETIQSTAVQSVRYDPKRNVCSLVFRGGTKSYDYRMTPREFETFMESLSKGRHVNYVMKYHNRMPGYPLKSRKRK